MSGSPPMNSTPRGASSSSTMLLRKPKTLKSSSNMSQMSSATVSQIASSQAIAQLTPIYGDTQFTHNRSKKTVSRKPHYPLHQPRTFVRPEWNPLNGGGPIYMTAPSLMSHYSSSLPRGPKQFRQVPMHPDFDSKSLRYHHSPGKGIKKLNGDGASSVYNSDPQFNPHIHYSQMEQSPYCLKHGKHPKYDKKYKSKPSSKKDCKLHSSYVDYYSSRHNTLY